MKTGNANTSKMPKGNSHSLLHDLFHKEFSPWVSILLTVVIMGVLIALVYLWNIPNPNMILIAGLVICSSLFGFSGGICAAVIMFGYTLFFFSEGHDFVTFTAQNTSKVFVSVFGIVVDMLFVCMLKHEEVKAFREVTTLTEKLHKENASLQTASLTDALTGIGNRLALRVDFDGYLDHELCAVLLDIDDFKSVNDEFGHDVGDTIIKLTAQLISDVFDMGKCYRFGGDEFIVILTELDSFDYVSRINSILEKSPSFNADGQTIKVNYSIGYQTAFVRDGEEWSKLLKDADTYMYEAKRSGKNRIVGGNTE